MSANTLSAIDRFMAKVVKEADCWTWTASGVPSGYGVFYYLGRQQYAHRVSYQLHSGEIPPGNFVLHRCDNPKCVNPAHLLIGTAKQNTADMISKKRQRFGFSVNPPIGERNINSREPWRLRGTNNPNARLTTAQVQAIRAEYSRGRLQKDIAVQFGIKQPQVSSIVRNESWVE